MRRVAELFLRHQDVAVHSHGVLRLPAPDAPSKLLCASWHWLRDCSAVAACRSDTGDIGQRRGMPSAATDQRLSIGYTPKAASVAAPKTLLRGGHASWSERPAHGNPQQHQQQRGVRLFEVP